MNERIITSVYLPDRGVLVDLPNHLAQGIRINGDDLEISMSDDTKERVKSIMNDGIMQNRYPTVEAGEAYMAGISPEWRQVLRERADSFAGEIVRTCHGLGHERIAVIMYGSVTRGLVKHPHHPDPSNIDLTVIGEFVNGDREEVLNTLRPFREHLTARIKQEEQAFPVPFNGHEVFGYVSPNAAPTCDEKVVRTGLMVQNVETLRKEEYFTARRYMSACAIPLHDPYGIWSDIEEEALPYIALHNLRPAERRRHRREMMQAPTPELVLCSV